jgi:hypothetical protein
VHWILFPVSALAVIGGGILVARSGDRLADSLGLTRLWVGSILVTTDGSERSLRVLPTSVDIRTDVTRIPEFKLIDTGILERAEKLRASVLALSTHGHRASTHLLAGSTSLGILQHSPIPLILARSGLQRP